MDSFSGDTAESTEDIPGRKKSKLKSLKSRLFGRSKRAGGEVNTKLSQSASDITAGKELGSDEDLACSQGMMGSRAFSHDSIFLADLVLSDAEPARVLSQENVHSKIKTLQMKLQQQKMHLGPPPLVLPIRHPEELCDRSEDDGLPQSPTELSRCDVTTQRALSKTISQPSCRPLSPILKPTSTKSVPPTPSHIFPLSVPSNPSPSVVEPPSDFSSPVQFTPCLDTSAARHRMSVKPKNQRASTKKRLAAPDSRLKMLNNVDHPEPKKEEEQWFSAKEEVTLEKEQEGVNTPITPQRLPSKVPELMSITSEATPKSSSLPFSQQDHVLPGRSPSISSQVLRVKPHRHGNVTLSERPHSSFIPSELKEKREGLGEFEIQVMSHDKRNSLNKADINSKEVSSAQLSTSLGSLVAPRSSSVYQQFQSEPENNIGINRPSPGSGSFHFSMTTAKNRDGERPRSSSFVGVLGQAGTWQKTGGGAEDTPPLNMKEKEGRKDLQPTGGPISVGRLRQDGAPQKSSVLPWDRRDSLKKVESVTTSKNVTTDAGASEVEELESSQELVEEAVEAKELQEEEGKTAFGVKLRSTSQSMRFRSDATSNHHLKPLIHEEQCDKQKTQEIKDNANYMSKKLPTSTSGDLRLTDPAPSGFSLPVKNDPTSNSNPPTTRTEVQTTSKDVEAALAGSQEPQPAPQTASSEVSWMSLAMEKTRSLQQLFTSRFPRDLTGGQAVARPQAQPTNQTETSTGEQIETQTVKLQQSTTPLMATNQLLTDTVKAETAQSRGQLLTVKSSVMQTVQEKTSTTSPGQSNTSKEQQMSKQVNETQLHTSTSQPVSNSVSHPAVQTNLWTTQFPLRSPPQTDTKSQFAQASATQTLAQSYLSSGQQQPPWSNRSLQPLSQSKSTISAMTSVCTTSTAAALSPLSTLGKGERAVTVLEKESPSVSGKREVWAGSISEKAAFLEKRAEWTTLSGTKGVEVKKARTDIQTSDESPVSVKTTPLSKDTKLEIRQGVNLAESSPTKIPDRPREDKWLRKNTGSFSSPSSSPTLPSALQSMSESGQPSWMELAKRKSMAWSDKTMD